MSRPGLVARGLDAVLDSYQRHVSPLLGPACRFHPTCSHYARRALATESLLRALGLIVWRLLRCQPYGGSGADPVPADRPAARAVEGEAP